MPDRTARPIDASATDPTRITGPRTDSSVALLSETAVRLAPPGPVILAEGSAPDLTDETQTLLRQRLRLAAIVLFAGLGIFLVDHFFVADFSRPGDVFLFALHAVTMAVPGVLAAALCRDRAISLGRLRASEVAIFGLPVLFFLCLQYFYTLTSCALGHFDFPDAQWLVVIYTYALFIPNTLRRAAVAIGLMAALPIALLVAMMWADPQVARLLTNDELTGLVLLFVLAAGGSVFGVGTIGSLRREAFEARQLGRYRLKQRIGSGGMGEVYLAEHQLLKRPCMIKLIRPDKAGDAKTLARFQREVRATAKLSHWNTVEIFDYGCTADGTFYYVMEYLPGMSLAELVERYGPMPPERVIHLLRQACDALSEAHAAGLIHRDIKPGNIFAAQRGGVYDVAKLLDFGLVKPLTDDQPVELTAEGSITGSPLFMSPEQALGETRPDARSDIYSLGAVGYYLLTGRPPFTGERPIQVLIAQAHDPVIPPSQFRPEIPADVEQVILRCLAKSPAHRFPDAASLAQALAECQAADRWTRAQAAQWWQEQEQEVAV
jgi:serine/threonine-protein kinase